MAYVWAIIFKLVKADFPAQEILLLVNAINRPREQCKLANTRRETLILLHWAARKPIAEMAKEMKVWP